MELASPESAFPRLTAEEMELVRPLATVASFADGERVFCAGERDVDFFVVESGRVEIINPTDDGHTVTRHDAKEFVGDIDLLTRRPVVVSAVARGATVLLRIAGDDLRRLLNTVPRLSEKLIVAFAVRRSLLQDAGVFGFKVIGQSQCQDTTTIREFLFRNFVPYTWFDTDEDAGRDELAALHRGVPDTPLVECFGDELLVRPSLHDLAHAIGVLRPCPERVFDLAIVGAGPAGLTAAIYAASEGLKTVVLDRLGPGGQAGGSSLIENFVGFPSGLSGAEFATRGVLQMMKFGAELITPVTVDRFVPGEEHHELLTDDGQTVRARYVLIASGARWRRLEAKNAARFDRAGVYYAATHVESRVCTGEDVVVIGGGNSAGQAAMFLSECSGVRMLVRGDELSSSMSEYLAHRIEQNERIEVTTGVDIAAVIGQARVEGVEVVERATGVSRTLPCAAVFVFIGAEPNTSWLPDAVARDRRGYVLTGSEAFHSGAWPLEREPCAVETTVPRLFAAGDVRAGTTKRVAFAVGDGAMAVTCLHQAERGAGR